MKIDEALCNGCGACVTGCHEGALRIINGKAVMISDLYCDGLGACIGECPSNAISFEEREAVPYDEVTVMEKLIQKGEGVIRAHLNHLKQHNAHELFKQALYYLEGKGMKIDFLQQGDTAKNNHRVVSTAYGCPGSKMKEFKRPVRNTFEMTPSAVRQPSELRQFPVQLHLIYPHAGFMRGADLLLAADCTAFAYGNFHDHFLKVKILAIACPKLDQNIQAYVDKFKEMIDVSEVRTITILIIEVPSCSGLVGIACSVLEQAIRKLPVEVITISVEGEVLKREYL